ncbi:hypothetical protein RUM44_006135 [Polyplax serrata]|uniref:Uncharacterized protein n=1 Tax=Polyplax serrata TaxID=468196 RepID=A0ABR1AZ15_POLSC
MDRKTNSTRPEDELAENLWNLVSLGRKIIDLLFGSDFLNFARVLPCLINLVTEKFDVHQLKFTQIPKQPFQCISHGGEHRGHMVPESVRTFCPSFQVRQ